MKNKYGFIGFISLLGLIGVFNGNKDFYAFITFAIFFKYFFVTPDEMFIENMRKAASWAFFSGQAITVIITLAHTITKTKYDALTMGITLGWSISIIVFCLSTIYFEWKDSRGIER